MASRQSGLLTKSTRLRLLTTHAIFTSNIRSRVNVPLAARPNAAESTPIPLNFSGCATTLPSVSVGNTKPQYEAMDFTSGDPTWWAGDIDTDTAFNSDQHVNGIIPIDGAGSHVLPPPGFWTLTDESTYVNPEDLQLKQALPFGDATRGQLSCDAVSNRNLSAILQPLSALDKFLVSQGGWRPPLPCGHCKRLRLQCFMLQTTQDNPNPIKSCSSCVALYRHCSLAGPAKRQASQFETSQPVIGQLHGVYEDDTAQPPHTEIGGDSLRGVGFPAKLGKRSSSRSNTGTRPLRIWFNAHLDNPYPSESAKDSLCRESGLSRTQVSNWFSNARRRKKHSEQAASAAGRQIHRQGSPMPVSSISQLTPFERWQNSPPEDDPADFADIESAIQLSPSTSSLRALQQLSGSDHLTVNMPDCDSELGWLSLPASVDSSSNVATSRTSQQSFDAHSASSKRSLTGSDFNVVQRKRRQHSDKPPFKCTNCARTFTRKSDITRHDKAIHLQPKETWVCSGLVSEGESPLVWEISAPAPSCAFCGHTSPDERHFLSHEFVSCADRSVADRTFARKDHLRQHLYKFHKCRKWDGWNLDERMERLRRVGDG